MELLSDFEFRKATAEEVAEITAYYNEVRTSVDPSMQEATDWAPFNDGRVQQAIQAQKLFLVRWRGTDALTGAAMLSIEAPPFWREPEGLAIYAEKISVAASLRRGGLRVDGQMVRIGSQVLLPFIEEYARTRGVEYFRLDYPTENKKLGEYYLRNGFQIIDRVTYTGPLSGNPIRATLLQRPIKREKTISL